MTHSVAQYATLTLTVAHYDTLTVTHYNSLTVTHYDTLTVALPLTSDWAAKHQNCTQEMQIIIIYITTIRFGYARFG